ncbi:MAG: acetylornithine/succinylornithine family transaminase [Pseudomonadales bacterium]|nr:acetylornithine/succinylornithine family transaminase [Pseudomonadales bacterium]
MWPNYSPPQGLIFSHGKGSELITEEGEAYLDFLSGIAVTGFGHAHPHLVAALTEQASKLWHLSNVFRIPAAEELARRLADNSFADSVFFANSGTEAIEAGIKAMRGYHAAQGSNDRNRIIGFSDSFHGRTIAALAAAGNQSHMQNFVTGDYGFDHVDWENLEQLKNAIGPQTAGIILEPIQGEGGIRPVSQAFLQEVRELCTANGILLMFDEVQCGVGRSGHLFAHEALGIYPDVMALAKGLGGGFPIGVCLTTQVVADAMVVGTHGSTFGGNPLAAAVGNAVLDLVLEDGLLDSVKEKGQFFNQAIEDLIAKHPEKIESVHGLGLMVGIKCKISNANLLVSLRDNKLLVGKSGSNMIRLLPPLNVSQEHVEKAISILDSTLAAM